MPVFRSIDGGEWEGTEDENEFEFARRMSSIRPGSGCELTEQDASSPEAIAKVAEIRGIVGSTDSSVEEMLRRMEDVVSAATS